MPFFVEQVLPDFRGIVSLMNQPATARWLTISLILSGLHSSLWGCFIILLPERSAVAYGLAAVPEDLFLWQGTGLMILLLGIGYFIASTNPVQHWAVVLIGLLAKTLGPIGMMIAVIRGDVPTDVLWLLPVNDVLWWVPFTIIVKRGLRGGAGQGERPAERSPSQDS